MVDPKTGEILAERDEIIDHDMVRKLTAANVEEVFVRSPLTCELTHGICAKCYGMDLGRGKLVEIGSAVGIVAAQSIGEPGTQLTLRTFHTGGVAAGGDITTGLPRVEELFEARRMPKGEAVVSEIVWHGAHHAVRPLQRPAPGARGTQRDGQRRVRYPRRLDSGVEDATEVSQGDVMASLDAATIVAQHAGRVRIEPAAKTARLQVIVSYEARQKRSTKFPPLPAC